MAGRKIFQLPTMCASTKRMIARPVTAITHFLPIAER